MSDDAMIINLQAAVFNGKDGRVAGTHNKVPGIFGDKGMS